MYEVRSPHHRTDKCWHGAPIAAAGWRGVDDREDKLRRASARAHARRILDAIAAEKLARARLFEEGIRE